MSVSEPAAACVRAWDRPFGWLFSGLGQLFILRLHHLCLVLLLLCLPLPAWAGACEALFAGGQSPALLNPKLAERTTVLCNDAYATLASGVTHGPVWSAEHLTSSSLREAEAMAREGRFHEEDRLPPEDRASLSDYTRSGYGRG